MDEPCGGRHAEKRGDLGAAARLPVNHDAVGVSSEIGNILAYPLERSDEVRHADIYGVLVSRASNL